MHFRHKSHWTFLIMIQLEAIVVSLLLCVGSVHSDFYNVPLKRVPMPATNDAIREPNQNSFEVHLEEQRDNLRGKPGYGYYMQIGIGTPPQVLSILCDTGSSNFAVACTPTPDVDSYFNYSLSSTFEKSGGDVSVQYTQGDWQGILGHDMLNIPTLNNMNFSANIACINSSKNFFINGSHWHGILGLAYAEIARPDPSVEPFFESLVRQVPINSTFSMQLCGTISSSNDTDTMVGGSLTLGGIDPDLYEGDMLWTPITKEWYYEVIITDVKVNDESLEMDCKEYNFDKTIVDSGTTNLRFPDKVFKKVVATIKQKLDIDQLNQEIPDLFWPGYFLLCWSRGKTPWDAFPIVKVSLVETHNTTFDLVISPQQYLRAVDDEDNSANNSEECYKFGIATSTTGTVIGAVVMEGFYVAFDRYNKKVGFAKTTCPNRDASVPSSHVLGPHESGSTDNLACAFIKPENHQSTLMTVAYVMAGICGACLIPLILMIIQWRWHRCRKTSSEDNSDSSLLSETSGR